MHTIINISHGVAKMEAWRMAAPINFQLNSNEHLAIVGPNGSGKSMFVDILTGKHPLLGDEPEYNFSPSKKELVSDNIKYIAFRDSYGPIDSTYYLQKRWNQHDIDSETPTVGELLEDVYKLSTENTLEHEQLRKHLYQLFHIEDLIDKYIISLSSGELRKFQLTKALLSSPRVLIIDNPFIGLDTKSQQQLAALLDILSKENNLQIILVLSKSEDIPKFITHVVQVQYMKISKKVSLCEYLSINRSRINNCPSYSEKVKEIINLPYKDFNYKANIIVKMDNVNIKYGKNTILHNLNLTIKRGECWALSGENGAGKSTLLSLICADNPQSYACDIELFGKKRGTGESIWDIKKHIGYVSPEMHRAYHRDMPAIRIMASGFKDSIGLFTKPNEEEYNTCYLWLKIFGIEHLAEKNFLKLSSGEQRLILLARAFVKDPELLILDEPFHGLDNDNRLLTTEIINAFCKRRVKTLLMVSHHDAELPSCINHRLILKKYK